MEALGPSVEDVIEQEERGGESRLHLDVAKMVAGQLVGAVVKLHSRGVVHGGGYAPLLDGFVVVLAQPRCRSPHQKGSIFNPPPVVLDAGASSPLPWRARDKSRRRG